MMHEKGEHGMSSLVLPWRAKRGWKTGESAVAVNRRGDSLGGIRVTEFPRGAPEPKTAVPLPSQLVQVDVPTHLLWEARLLRRRRSAAVEDEAYLQAVERSRPAAGKVHITLDGERRMVRGKVSVTVALFETGQSRPEDVLYCPDGSCGLCQATVDGVRKLACQERIHRGMAVRLRSPSASRSTVALQGESSLCPCLGITVEQVVERLRSGSLQSPEAVLSATHVGEGRCHGQLCMEAFRRALLSQGIDASQWADWRFPWSEWTLTHN
jgi:hypothetical protein